MHLSNVVQDWLDANVALAPNKSTVGVGLADDDAVETDPLANLAALDAEDDEEGVIELVEMASEAMSEVVNIVERMTSATNELSEKFTQHTTEASAVSARGKDMKAAKKISNKAADDLETFVKRMAVEIREFNRQSSFAMETFGNIAMIAERDLNEDPEDIATARTNMQQYTIAITTSAESLSQFRNTIFNLPRMTTAFNRGRKRAVAVMDDLLNQLRIAASQSQDVESLLARLDTSNDKAQ